MWCCRQSLPRSAARARTFSVPARNAAGAPPYSTSPGVRSVAGVATASPTKVSAKM